MIDDPLFDIPIVLKVKGTKGDKGDKGDTGSAGRDGVDGKDGRDGIDGRDGADGRNGSNGNNGRDGKNGIDGKSAYQLWLSLGNKGSVEDFILSLRGADGLSAYDIWLNTNSGTEEDFLQWLKGKDAVYQNVGMSVPDLSGMVGRLKTKDAPQSTDDIMIRRAGSLFRVSFSDFTGDFVPYTGATDDVDLGAHSLTANRLYTGTPDTMIIGGVTIDADVQINSDTLAVQEIHTHAAAAAAGGSLYFARSRGTNASPTAVQNGDILGILASAGYDGTDYALGSYIIMQVSGVVGSNDMPTEMQFWTTPDGTQVPVKAMTIKSDQSVVMVDDLSCADITATGISVTKNQNGNTNIVVSNADTTDTGSRSRIVANAHHPVLGLIGSDASPYGMHLDPDDDFSYKETLSTLSVSTPHRIVSSAQITTLPLQPLVSAYLAAGVADVTGDGTVYTLTGLTELFDRNSEFDGQTYTATEAGQYHAIFACHFSDIGAGHTSGRMDIVTSNTTHQQQTGSLAAMRNNNNAIAICMSRIVDLDAGDTMTFNAVASNSTKTVNLTGSASFFVTGVQIFKAA